MKKRILALLFGALLLVGFGVFVNQARADVDWTYAVSFDELWNSPTYTSDGFWYSSGGPGQNQGLDGYWAYELRTRCTGSNSTASETIRVRIYRETDTYATPWSRETFADVGGKGSYVTDHPLYFHTPNYHDYLEFIVDSPDHHSPGNSPPCEWRLVAYYKAVWG